MADFSRFSFTAANGTAIGALTGDFSETWTAATWNSTPNPEVQSNLLRFPGDQFNRKAHYTSVTPPAANYMVELECLAINGARQYAGARMSTSAQTGYFGGFTDVTFVSIRKWMAGTFSEIATPVGCNRANGTEWLTQLEVSGSTLRLYVQRASDGHWLTTAGNVFGATRVACIELTDTDISAAGRAGFWCETTTTDPFDVVTWRADDGAPAGPAITTPPANQSVTAPATATFSATYTGTITAHQWQQSTDGGTTWASVPDGTGASGGAGTGATLSYTTTATAVSTGNHRNAYRYRLRLTHSGGTVDSAAAVLTVTAPTATSLVVTVPDAAGLSGFSAAVLSTSAPTTGSTVIKTATGLSFNGSGVANIDITGLGVAIGARRWVTLSNSNGDPAQSPAPKQAAGPVTAS